MNQFSLFPRGLLALVLHRDLSYQISINFCILMMLQGYNQEKDCREMEYLVLEQMASFKILSSILCTPQMCLFLFFFPSYSIWFNKRYCFCSQKFPSGKVCLFLVCCNKKKTQKTNKLKTNISRKFCFSSGLSCLLEFVKTFIEPLLFSAGEEFRNFPVLTVPPDWGYFS